MNKNNIVCTGRNPTILIVEDDGLIALWLIEFLSTSGYKVKSPVSSGMEAIESVRTFPPDLILMNIRLPGKIDGIETARQIRNTSDIPVLFLTAHVDIKDLSRAKEINLSVFIMKPIIENEILFEIGNALANIKGSDA